MFEMFGRLLTLPLYVLGQFRVPTYMCSNQSVVSMMCLERGDLVSNYNSITQELDDLEQIA